MTDSNEKAKTQAALILIAAIFVIGLITGGMAGYIIAMVTG